jgi:hypothetical protein
MNLLGYTAPDQRANAALHIAPHVMIYRHFARSTPGSARAPRAVTGALASQPRAKRLKLYAANALYQADGGSRTTSSLASLVAPNKKAARKIAEAHFTQNAGPGAFNFKYLIQEVSPALLAQIGEEAA